MLAMWVKVRIKPELREKFLKAIEADALGSERDEPGCLRFNVLQDAKDVRREVELFVGVQLVVIRIAQELGNPVGYDLRRVRARRVEDRSPSSIDGPRVVPVQSESQGLFGLGVIGV